MDWKRRAILQKKEDDLVAQEISKGIEAKVSIDTSLPRSLRPYEGAAKEITYDDLMKMMFKKEDEGADSEDAAKSRKAAQKEEWRSSRKFVNFNSVFIPR
jgi:hypothetical protein